MSMLKPKVKAFGFSRNVLKSIAAEIADKLDIEDDASDEDVNAKIEEAVNAVLPYLPMIQSQANSQFDEWKKANTPNDDDDDGDDSDNGDDESKSSKSNKPKGKKADEIPAWAKELIESNKTLAGQLAAIKGEKIADTRRSKLEKLLDGTKTFGESKLKDFGLMKFESDDDFDEFFSRVEEDLKAYNQERSNAGLDKLGPVRSVVSGSKGNKPEVLSDDEVKELAGF